MRVLITGANGFVGQSLIPYLLKHGHEVIGCTRNFQQLAAFEYHSHFQIRTVDDINTQNWTTLLKDVDAVVHLAARVHVMKDSEEDALAEYRKINVDATRRLAEDCIHMGVKRFIFLSSIKVNGENTKSEPFSEDDMPNPQDAYGISKLEAERELGRLAESSDLEVAIVRPPLIYGPRVKANFLNLLKAVDRNWPLPLGMISDNRRSLLHVENLISAIEKILIMPHLKHEVFLVADNESPSTLELVKVMKHSLKSKSILVPVPVNALRGLAQVVRKTPQIDRLTGTLQVSNKKIKSMTNWQPPLSFKEGVRQTADWLKNQKT